MEQAAAGTARDPLDDDRVLAERFLATRDERAFRLLYRRHAPALFRFTTRLAGGREDGEDLLQETWLRAAGALSRFRWDSTLRTWLCGVAVHRWREIARSRAASRRSGPVPSSSATHSAENETALDLERAIESLPEGYREVLVLHDLHGYTHEEIGAMLEIETGTSKSQLSRARRALRERFRFEGGAR
jgi:RNA polymerase sigma-70 factor (ECF subfamily)